MSDTHDLNFFRDLEEKLHRPEIRGSAETIDLLLADGFIEFGSSGNIYDKETIIKALVNEAKEAPPILPVASDYKLRSLSPDAVLITYNSTKPVAGSGVERKSLRSSLWKRIDGRWQMIFHQGTLC